MPALPRSRDHSQKAAGLVQSNKRPNRCAPGSACATSSLARKIDRFATPPATKLFCSGSNLTPRFSPVIMRNVFLTCKCDGVASKKTHEYHQKPRNAPARDL